MSLRDDYLRLKGRWKQKLGMSSANASSTTVEGETHSCRSRSPMPPMHGKITGITPDNAPFPSGPSSHSSTAVIAEMPLTSAIQVSVPAKELPTDSSKPGALTQDMTGSNDLPATTSGSTKSVAWSGLRTLLQMLESSSDVFPPLNSAVLGLSSFASSQGHEEYKELGVALDGLLGDISGYIGSRTGPKMTNSVKNLWIGLDRELQMVQVKYNRGGMQRLAEALDDPEEIAKYHRRIHSHLERLALNANLSMWETVNESATETRLHRLSPALSAVYNSARSVDVKRRLCTPGTREKELEKLLEWARNKSPEAEDVYWMNGMAGTGKTTIAYSLCAELEASSELAASFFCSRLLPECRDVNLIIPCIAYQLARFSIPFRHALSKVLEADPDVHTRVLKTQFESLLIEPLTEVKNTLPADFVVVIDTLDECDSEDSVGLILDTLLSHRTSKLPVRFLLSSRPESEIYDRMMGRVGHSFDARLVLHNVDADVVRQDIRTYLEAELAAVSPTSAQLTALVELSGVLFIFASTAVRYITDGLKYMVHKKRLNMILGLSPATSGSKGDAIDKLYASILKAVFDNESIEESLRTQLKMILDAVICAQEPMTVDAIAGLLEEESGRHVEVLLRRLSSVVNIAEFSGLVTTLHASFPDYMLDHRRSASFHCHPPKTHLRLSHACFEAIKSQDPQFNACGLQSSYLRDEQDPELEERASMIISPQLLYACRYWVTHLESADEFNESQNRLWDFLSSRLLLWMEVLNIRDHIHLAPDILQRAESWSRTTGCAKKTTELAHDAWRFVTMFAGHAVSKSTPHIYVSMLPLWPAPSPIAKHYWARIRGEAEHGPRGTAMTRRRMALLTTWMFDDVVYVVRFSPNGSFAAIAVSSSVYIIDSITGRTILGPLAHDGIARTAAFSPDGTLLATGSQDWSLRMWNTSNGELVWRAPLAHTGYVISLSFLPDGARLVSGGDDSSLRVWDVGTGDTILGPVNGHADGIMSVSVSPDGTRIASGSTDNTIRVWDSQTGDIIIAPLEGHSDRIDSVCFSPDGTRLVSGAWDNTVRVWSNLTGLATVKLLLGHTNHVNSVAFSPDGKYIISGSRDFTIRLWDGNANLGCVAVLRGHMDTVLSVAFSSDSTRIVSGSHDRTVRIWDVQSQDAISSLPLSGHTNSVTSVGVSHDGRHILSGSSDSTLFIWDAQSGQPVAGPFMGHTERVSSACFSPDEMLVVSGAGDATVRWWNAHSGNVIDEQVTGHTDQVWSVCCSLDGALVASGSADHTIRLWNARTHESIGSPLEGHTDTVRSVCFSPDGSRLVSGSLDGTVMVWDVESEQQVYPPLQGHASGVTAVRISPDGMRVVSGSLDMTVQLWNLQDGTASLGPLRGHSAGVTAVQFSPDGLYIVSCSMDKTLRIWNEQTGEAVGTPLLGHTESVRCCSFSPCGRWIVSGSADRAIRIWDVSDLVGLQGSKEVHQVDNRTTDRFSESASWHLQEDGWVVDAQSRHLAWVPPDLRHVLMSPRNTLLISTDGSLKLEFDHTKLGENWAENYAA